MLARGPLEEVVEWNRRIFEVSGHPRVVRGFTMARRVHHAHNVDTRLSASLASTMPRALILGGARTPFVRAGTAFAELIDSVLRGPRRPKPSRTPRSIPAAGEPSFSVMAPGPALNHTSAPRTAFPTQ